MRKILTALIFYFVVCMLWGCANLGPLSTLVQLGKSEALKQKVRDQETTNFQRLKVYIETNKIEKGISKRSALRLFGQPVIIFYKGKIQEWVYKESQTSWFGGEKIYLYFDEGNRLTYWQHLKGDSDLF